MGAPRARGAGEPAESLGVLEEVRVFVGPVLRVGGERGRQHRAEVWVRVKKETIAQSTTRRRRRRGGGRDAAQGAHRHACHRLITLTSLTDGSNAWEGRRNARGGEVGGESSSGARRILVNPPGWFLFFSRGGIPGTRVRGDAGRMNRVRARGRDVRTRSSPCRPLNRPPAPDGTTLHYYDLEASTRRFQINTRAASGYFLGVDLKGRAADRSTDRESQPPKRTFSSRSPRHAPGHPAKTATRDSSTHDAPANHPPPPPIIRAPRGARSEAGDIRRARTVSARTRHIIISRDRVRRPAESSRLWERER